ncbi:ATP-dependent DNA ligase [Amycolatopsis sp. NPDC051071]|uniref:DNA polymerase domain-containing protein n=1 Tax=Amycolatopsis sp. NPDC051071 TaxID=3154637 RepID=UPI00341C9D9C
MSDDDRDGVKLSNLDQPLFEDATKRDLVDYLDAVAGRIIPVLANRPLSVIRILRGQGPFMQKNLPKYTPEWVKRHGMWAETSKREVSYALCDDRRTLMWFANQRAVEYHPTLMRVGDDTGPTHLVLDLDPPPGDDFAHVVKAAALVRQALADSGLAGAVKTSGSKGVHIFVPLVPGQAFDDVAAATRALAARAEQADPSIATTAYIVEDREGKVYLDAARAGGGTVASAYSPRLRPGLPVSFPVSWNDLENVVPADFTVYTAPALLGDKDLWAEMMPEPQSLPADLVEQGHTIPIARVVAMHEGKRRARMRAQNG